MSKLESLYPTLEKRASYNAQLTERAKALLQDQLKGKDIGDEFNEVLKRQAVTHMGNQVLMQLALKPSKIVTDEAR